MRSNRQVKAARWRWLPLLLLVACRPAPSAPKGRVEGKVEWSGEAPRLPALQTSGAAVHACGSEVKDRSLEVSPSGGVAYALVFLAQGATLPVASQKTPAPAVMLDQKGCTYDPPVLGAQVGAPLVLQNSDPLVHTVHAQKEGQSVFNVAMPLAGQKVQRVLPTAPAILPLRCDVHPWMRAVLRTFEHPYFTRTDAEGNFSLEVPAGDHTLVLWHPRLPEQSRKLKVTSGGVSRITFQWNAAQLHP